MGHIATQCPKPRSAIPIWTYCRKLSYTAETCYIKQRDDEIKAQTEVESKKNPPKPEKAMVVAEVKQSDRSLEDDEANVPNMKRSA